MSDHAQLGSFQFGDLQYSGEYELEDFFDSPNSGGNFRTQIGFGQFGNRVYSRPESLELAEFGQAGGGAIVIEVVSASGALVGKIRSDVQKSIINSLVFTDGENGSEDATLSLNELPDFPIEPFSIISVKLADTPFFWYAGTIQIPDQEGTQRDEFEFRAIGLKDYLRGLKSNRDFGVGLDVGEIVRFIIENDVVPFAPIGLNTSKIDESTGVLLANPIELSENFLDKVLNTFQDMSGRKWGVDGDGDFFFLKPSDTQQRTYFEGYDMSQFLPEINFGDVRNAIVVQRQQGRGSGGAGWEIAGVFNDASSVAKYGRRELNYQIPGFFETAEANIVGDALLADKAEPKFSAKMIGRPILDGDDFLPRGLYRFINQFSEYEAIYNAVDDSTQWAKIGSGDLVISDEATLFVFGDGAVKLTFTDALNDRAELSDVVSGAVQRVRFFVSAPAGVKATVGVGESVWSEHTTTLDVPVNNRFFNFDWDVSALGIRKIGKFAIRIDEPGGTGASEFSILIDKVVFNVKGNKTYRLELKDATYTVSPTEVAIDAEFGVVPPKMENFLQGLFAVADELRFTGEIR